MDRRAAGALLALAACIASSAAAPTVSNQTALDLYDAASEGCYYNFQHYGEGDRIMTNEPCLNCTCHNRMLMCYLRVCPFTKPIGQDCTVEKRADQCCPIVTCPDVPVDLLTSTSTTSPAEYGATGLGKLDKYGCSISGKYFPEGSKVPPTPNKPCEHCYCIRNMTTCVMQECTLHVDGCTPIYHKDVCCPVRYSCDHPEDEMPLLDDMSTTVRPTPGFLLTTTTLSPVTQITQDCVHNDQIFSDGTSIKTEKACEHCYCMKGDIVCVVQECGTPMENEGKNCTSQPPREGQCCPDTYICEGDEVTTESLLDFTTEPSLEMLTTLVPPRRVLDEGSGYRKEEEEPIATAIPSFEPEIEGSGEDFATLQPSKETEKETPSLFDERFSSTEDLIGVDTTPEPISETEKATAEPDYELNTVPSDVTEASDISEPKLTTISIDTETSQEAEQAHDEINFTTASTKEKEEEVSVQTTESAFRKEDDSHIPLDITTQKALEEYTTVSVEPTRATKPEEQEASVAMSETKATVPSETVTEILTSTISDNLVKESSTSFDHTLKETLTTEMLDQTKTTTLNAQENEIEDISTTQGPSRIPGEGDCLQNGVTYRNESAVPSNNNCLTDCKCISSIIKCDPIICSPPPEYMNNCVPIYDSSESCCPTYVCDGSKETLPPQPHSQMSETTSSSPIEADDCQGDQCEVHKIDEPITPVPFDSCDSGNCENKPNNIPEFTDCETEGCRNAVEKINKPVTPSPSDSCDSGDCENKPSNISESTDCGKEGCSNAVQKIDTYPTPVPSDSCDGGDCENKPSNIPQSPDCGTEGCTDAVQTPVQNEVQPECDSENCGAVIQPAPHEILQVPIDTCTDSTCQQHPIIEKEKDEAVQPCQNEDECKTIKSPEVESCNEESCKNVPSDCNDKNCDALPDNVSPTCQGDSCGSKDIEEPGCLDDECKKTNITDITGKLPVECIGDDCMSQPEKTEKSTESSIPTQEQITLSPVTELIQIESTAAPEHEDSQTSDVIEQATTDKDMELTNLDEVQSTLQPSSEKPLSDSDENLEKTIKPSTDLPIIQTTAYVQVKETTSVSDLDYQTNIKQGEINTTPTQAQESEEALTTKFTDLVTKLPEIVDTTEITGQTVAVTEESILSDKQSEQEGTSIQDKSTEYSAHHEDITVSPTLSFDSKPESETTEYAQFDSSAQPSTEHSKPAFDMTSQYEQYTKEPELGSGEETTELLNIPKDEIVSVDRETETEGPSIESGETSQTPIIAFDKEITTSLPELPEKEAEQTPVTTSVTSEYNTTPGYVVDVSTEIHNKQTDIHDLQTQEPTMQTTTVSESHEKLNKQDETTAKSDIEHATTQPSISSETYTADINKPLIDKEKLPELPTEEIFTEQTDIETEEPSLINKQDEVTPHESIETESPAYIPVHPILDDKSEFDLIERNTTPDSGSDVMLSTEQTLHSELPDTQTEQSVPELESYTKPSPEVITDQYDHVKSTEIPGDLSPTDNRKYNQDTTEVFDVKEPTTTYPDEDKITVFSATNEPSTSKPSMEEGLYVTTPSELFSDKKSEIIPTEMPESHVKETESGLKLTAIPEIVTEKLETIQTDELQTLSPPVFEPKPTVFQPSTISVELEKEPEHDLETSTKYASESTLVPQFEHSETTPDMIELVEHNEMLDVSTLPSSISDLGTTIGAETEKYIEHFTTDKIVTPIIEIDSDTTVKSHIIPSEQTDDETLVQQPEVSTDREIITEQPLEQKPYEMDTFKPDIDMESSTETVEVDKDSSTRQPEKPDFAHQTTSSEIVQTDKPEITKSDVDQRTTEQAEENVTESKVEFDIGSGTEEPDKNEIQTKPDTEYSTTKPEIEPIEPESTTLVSEIPSIDETIETKEPTVEQYSTMKPEIEQEPVAPESTTLVSEIKTEEPTIENEVIPEQDNVKPTLIPEGQKETTSEKETVTGELETASTEQDIKPNLEFTTQSTMISETVKESVVESSTEQRILPELGEPSDVPESPSTEKESLSQETKEPELDIPHVESSTESVDIPVSEEKLQSQPSTKQPEITEPEQNIIDDKSTEQPIISELEKETGSSEITEKTKPDEEPYTQSPEKALTTIKADNDFNINKESSVTEPEPSDIENEVLLETTAILPEVEHVSSTEATFTEQPVSSIDLDFEKKPSTERVIPKTDKIPEIIETITEASDQVTEESDSTQKPTTNVPYITESAKEPEKETSTQKSEESTTISSDLDSRTTKSDVSEDQLVPEVITKEPEISVVSVTEHETEPPKLYTTDRPEMSSINYEATTAEPIMREKEVTEPSIMSEPDMVTNEPETPEVEVKDEVFSSSPSSEQAVDEHETTEKVTTVQTLEEYTKFEDEERETTTESKQEKLTTTSELAIAPSATEKEKLPDQLTEATPDIHDGSKQDEDITKYTTPGYTPKNESTVTISETEKPYIPEKEITVYTKPKTEKPIDIAKDTTPPEEEFLTVTSKATTPRVDIETSTHSEDFDKITKPHEVPEETSSVATPEIPKPGFNEVHGTDDAPVPEEESHFAPSATGGYGQEPDYEDESQPFGPGTCRYGGKVYVSAQQIPRDDPCDFCFCFRSDIICLQQSCPPPIHGCHEEPIQGFCCPRYECPVSMANTLNVTTTTTTTTTTLPPHFLPHAYQGAVHRRGCQIKGHTYKVGEVVRASSGPCLHCTCGGDGQMKCDPKACTPEPMLRQMIAAAVSAKRRR